MKKKIMFRCMLGAPIGLALSYMITVIISITVSDGKFYPVVPELADACGTELNAVLLQTVCSLLYGAAWAGASAIWEAEQWSLLRMTVTHLTVCSVFTFPIAYFMYWIPHSLAGFFSYYAFFFAVYLFIWLFQYSSIKKKIERMNQKVREI